MPKQIGKGKCPFCKQDKNQVVRFWDSFTVRCACGAQGPLEDSRDKAIAVWSGKRIPVEVIGRWKREEK